MDPELYGSHVAPLEQPAHVALLEQPAPSAPPPLNFGSKVAPLEQPAPSYAAPILWHKSEWSVCGTSRFFVGRRASLPSGELNYILEGPEGGPLVVCIHGLNASLATYERVVPVLCRAGLRVLAYDLCGFGLSSPPRKGRLDHHTCAEQLLALLAAIGTPLEEKVCLFGFSMGGVIAIEFARRYPDRCAKGLLVAPGGLLKKSETPCHNLVFKVLRRRFGGGCFVCCVAALAHCCACAIRRHMRGKAMFPVDACHPQHFEDISRVNTDRFAWNPGRAAKSYLSAIRHMPLWEEYFGGVYEEVAASSVPVLFMWGDSDNTVPWQEAGSAVNRLFSPYGRSCIIIPNAGHAILVECPEIVGNCAVAWFRDFSDPPWLQCLADWKMPVRVNLSEQENGLEPEPDVVGAQH